MGRYLREQSNRPIDEVRRLPRFAYSSDYVYFRDGGNDRDLWNSLGTLQTQGTRFGGVLIQYSPAAASWYTVANVVGSGEFFCAAVHDGPGYNRAKALRITLDGESFTITIGTGGPSCLWVGRHVAGVVPPSNLVSGSTTAQIQHLTGVYGQRDTSTFSATSAASPATASAGGGVPYVLTPLQHRLNGLRGVVFQRNLKVEVSPNGDTSYSSIYGTAGYLLD